MLAIDNTSNLVPVVVTSADFAATGQPFVSVAAAAPGFQLLPAQPVLPHLGFAPHVTTTLKVWLHHITRSSIFSYVASIYSFAPLIHRFSFFLVSAISW